MSTILFLSPYLAVSALSFIILATTLIISFYLQEPIPVEDRVYATTSTNSSAFLNSSLVGTENTANNTEFGNFTSTPSNIKTSSGPEPGSLQIPYTGLSRYHVTPQVAKLFGLNDTTYAMIVTEVESGSPAAVAGLRGGNITTNVAGDIIKHGGDVILRVDGNDTFVRTNEAFLNYLRNEKKVGENMSLSILRDGQVSEVQLTIGALPRFLWYEDIDEGIKIKYPSDWEVSRSESIQDIVKFFSPQNVRVGNDTEPLAGIFLVTSPAQDRGLDDLATEEQSDTRVKRNLDITLTTVSNLPGYETIFYEYSDENRTLKELSAFTIKNGDIYRINYATDPSRYEDYLPLAREIIRSFQFTK